MRATLLACLLLAACAGDSEVVPDPGCQVAHRPDVQLGRVRDSLLLPARIEGARVQMILDTGAGISTVSPGIATSLGLPAARARNIRGVGGSLRRGQVIARDFAVGQLPSTTHVLAISLGEYLPGLSPPVAGLAGPDAFAGYDLDLDAPRRQVRLASIDHCPGFRPWAGAMPVVMTRPPEGVWTVPVEVDGAPVTALLDTGARASFMTRRMAASLGVTAGQLARDPSDVAFGFNRKPIAERRHRFAALRLGPRVWTDVLVAVGDAPVPAADMILGADLITRQEMWFAPARGIMFVR